MAKANLDNQKPLYDIVERPSEILSKRPGRPDRPVDAVVSTAKTGKAVRIWLNGKKVDYYTTSLHSSMKRRGLNFHWTRDPDAPRTVILAWAEVPNAGTKGEDGA